MNGLSAETQGRLLMLGAIVGESRTKRWWQFWRKAVFAAAPPRSNPDPAPINWDAMRERSLGKSEAA